MNMTIHYEEGLKMPFSFPDFRRIGKKWDVTTEGRHVTSKSVRFQTFVPKRSKKGLRPQKLKKAGLNPEYPINYTVWTVCPSLLEPIRVESPGRVTETLTDAKIIVWFL